METCKTCWLRYNSYCMGCKFWTTGIGLEGQHGANDQKKT